MRGHLDRLAGSVAHTHPVPCSRQQLVDHLGDDDLGPVVAIALEQMRQRRSPGSLMSVVASDQRDRSATDGTQPTDDAGEDAGQLGRDDEQPLLVRLGRNDLEQRDDLTRVWQAVTDNSELGELEQLFDSDAGVSQCLDDCPRPERLVLEVKEIESLCRGDEPASKKTYPPWVMP